MNRYVCRGDILKKSTSFCAYTHILENIEIIQSWARDGKTHEEIAAELGVTVVELYEARKKRVALKKVLSTGKAASDATVENAVYRCATGFTYAEEIWERQKQHKGPAELVMVKRLVKQYLPNIEAQKFYLTNRKSGAWQTNRNITQGLEARETTEKLNTFLDATRPKPADIRFVYDEETGVEGMVVTTTTAPPPL